MVGGLGFWHPQEQKWPEDGHVSRVLGGYQVCRQTDRGGFSTRTFVQVSCLFLLFFCG